MCPGEEAGISAHALQARGILEEKLFCSACTGQQINSRGWMGGVFSLLSSAQQDDPSGLL